MFLKRLFSLVPLSLAIANCLTVAGSIQKISSLAGGIENNNGRLRLNLINNSSEEFRGYAIVGIGGESEQKEIGRAPLAIGANEHILLRLDSVAASGGHYKLAVYQSLDQREKLVFFKIAPIKTVSDTSIEGSVSLLPTRSAEPRAARGDRTPSSIVEPYEAPPVGDEVRISPKLLAGTGESDPFIISFEFASQRPVFDARLSLAVGKFRESRTVSINRQSNIRINLPDQLDSELFVYTLTGKDGRMLAKGEIDLGRLMSDDFVTAADIRTDRAAYDAGDSVKIEVLLEGSSKAGYRIEAIVKNGKGNIIFTDQRLSSAEENKPSQEFTLTIPRDSSGPITFEFKIYDADSGLLFDSGERGIPLYKG
jgi:hypothetical protein